MVTALRSVLRQGKFTWLLPNTVLTGGYISKRGNQMLIGNVLPSWDKTLVTEKSSQVIENCTNSPQIH